MRMRRARRVRTRRSCRKMTTTKMTTTSSLSPPTTSFRVADALAARPSTTRRPPTRSVTTRWTMKRTTMSTSSLPKRRSNLSKHLSNDANERIWDGAILGYKIGAGFLGALSFTFNFSIYAWHPRYGRQYMVHLQLASSIPRSVERQCL